MNRRLVVKALALTSILGMVIAGFSGQFADAQTTPNSRFFPETKQTVSGIFLKYWNEHGGLAQQGYPISNEFTEVSDLNGKPYTVQYFERAVFEKHPENRPPYDVLLSQLGTFQYRAKYPNGAPNQRVNTSPGATRFRETGFTVGGKFLDYWRKNGGLPQQGYPISNEFTEISDLNGLPYTVQYFERAVFELHPEHAGTQYEVLLSQLGTFQYRKKYQPSGTPGPIPPSPQGTSAVPVLPSPVGTAGAGSPPLPVPTRIVR